MIRHRLVVLLVGETLPLDLAIPLHVFAREAPEFYDVVTAAAGAAPVALAGGSAVVPDGGLELLESARTVVVPGYSHASTTALDPVTLDLLGEAAARDARMVSICSGAFALAQAGVLDGLVVTTHRLLCARLAEQHPALTVDPAALFVDNGSVLTSGGVTAGLDLALHLLRHDLGTEAAHGVARRLVVAPRREGDQTQFVQGAPAPSGDDVVATTQRWVLTVMGSPLTVARMAEQAHVSVRTFHRRFVATTSQTPLAWLQGQRVGRARELLETTDLTVERIAHQVGLGTPANLRRHFHRATSLSPARYRQQFSRRPLDAGLP